MGASLLCPPTPLREPPSSQFVVADPKPGPSILVEVEVLAETHADPEINQEDDWIPSERDSIPVQCRCPEEKERASRSCRIESVLLQFDEKEANSEVCPASEVQQYPFTSTDTSETDVLSHFPALQIGARHGDDMFTPKSSAKFKGAFSSTSSFRGVPTLSQDSRYSSMRMVMHGLQTTVDASILRGVDLAFVLGGFGRAFHNAKSGGLQAKEDDYLQSRETHELDDFISHEWRCRRISKAVTLCFVYNSPASFIAGLVTTILMCYLQLSHVEVLPMLREMEWDMSGEVVVAPVACWCSLTSPAVAVFFLLYWQRLRCLLCLGLRRKLVFVDKYCIDQSDDERKTLGVYGLAGFLKHSKRLLVVWSPRYFTRLWCTYEIASWLHLGKPLSAILVVPTSQIWSVAIMFFFSCVMISLDSVTAAAGSWWYIKTYGTLIVGWPVFLHLLRLQVREMRMLATQLKTFTIANAKCFCCECGHKCPDTGATLQCDRNLVYSTIAYWYESERRSPMASWVTHEPSNITRQSACLDMFDQHVRNLVGTSWLEYSAPTRMPYKYIVYVCSPLLWVSGDVFASLSHIWTVWQAIRYLSKLMMNAFCVMPSVWQVVMILLVYADERVGGKGTWCSSALVTIASSVTCICCVAALFIPIDWVQKRVVSPYPQIGVTIFNLLVAWVVLRPCRRRRNSRRQAASPL